MKCTSCNAEIPDVARFCPYCGQNVSESPLADAAEQQQAAASTEAFPTQEMKPQVESAAAASPYAAALGAQQQAPQAPQQPQPESPYSAYKAPQTQPIEPMQPIQPIPEQRPYGAPEPPQGYTGYSAANQGQPQSQAQNPYGAYGQSPQQTQPMYGGQVSQQSTPSYVGYSAGAASSPAATQRKKTPLIIAIVVIVALVAVLAACAALGVGPFAKGSNDAGNYNETVAAVDPGDDPLDRLDAAIRDIEDSGSFEGDYSMDMTIDMGSLGASIGMETIDVTMNGSYWMENYDRNDMSNLKMHMTMDMETMGETSSYVIDFSDGQATTTINGESQSSTYTAEDMAQILSDSGGMVYDSSALREYVKDSRIEGDTIFIELDDEFMNKLLANSLGEEGLSDMEAEIDSLELQAKIGDGSVEQTTNMDFNMSYTDYDLKTTLDMKTSMKKR